MSCNCGIQSYCSLCKRWKFALLDKKNMSYLENKSKGSANLPLTHWYNGDDKPIKFHEFYIEPKEQKELIYIKTRINGFEQTISVPFGSRLNNNKEKINE